MHFMICLEHETLNVLRLNSREYCTQLLQKILIIKKILKEIAPN